MFKLALIVFFEITNFPLETISLWPISKRMREAKIAPDLILFPPNEECNVTFSTNLSEVPGWPINYPNFLVKPKVTWNCDEKSYYVLSVTDCDLTNKKYSEENFKEWHAWLVYNIPGCRVDEGIELFPYKAPFSPLYNFDHRMVFLIWKQPAKIKGMRLDPEIFKDKFTPPRALVEIESYLSLFGIGHPVAGTYFLMIN